jgi:hypothetical protein
MLVTISDEISVRKLVRPRDQMLRGARMEMSYGMRISASTRRAWPTWNITPECYIFVIAARMPLRLTSIANVDEPLFSEQQFHR